MTRKRSGQSLRPVQDVVGRLRYDATFDAARFVVGYEERFSGARETPLLDFLGASEIPWHRIFYVKAGSLVVWDRRARIDLVFGSGDSPAADHPAIARACAPEAAPAPAAPDKRRRGDPDAAEFVARPCHRWDAARGAWTPVSPAGLADARVESLQVATYNVLFDLYEVEKIYSERRLVACLELLRACEADVLALQEVTPALWAALLAEPWVRASYYVSSGPDASDLRPYGQALLSRWPLALELHSFSTKKSLLVGRLALAGRPLLLASVHLTSNYRGDADDRRAEQLAVLAARVGRPDVAEALVLGDFNFGDEEENDQLATAGFADAWSLVHPHHPGFTFDPVKNPLAAIMSRTGRAARFDRVLLRAPGGGALAPIAVEVFGDRPFSTGPDGQEMFASDHFGLCALLQVGEPPRRVVDAAPVHTSALVLIPPEQHWAQIQAIRAEHDPSYQRWMPHINLVYGFVPEDSFPAAAEAIAAALRRRAPLRVRFEGLRRFDHRGSTTVWLEPHSDPPDALRALQADLAALFPRCDEQGARSPAGFTPHLTIAKLTGGEATIAAFIARFSAALRPFECTLDAVHLISRRGDEPFAVRHTLSLGTPARGALAELPPWAALPSPRHVAVAEAIAEACAAVTGAPRCLHVVGSARLGVAEPDSDLDLVCAGPDDQGRDALFAAVCERLARRGPLRARPAASAGLPVLRGTCDGVDFDLQYAGVPPVLRGRELFRLSADELAWLDDASRRAALGCVDADALVRLSGAGADAFRGLLRRVRRWARARQLDAGAWGLLGGYTWALLAAWAARDAVVSKGMSAEPWPLMRHFFAVFGAWPPGRPVAFGPAVPAPQGRRAQWPIYTPTPPVFNSARNLTSATCALVTGELRRGLEIVRAAGDEDAALSALCEPAAPGAHPSALVLELEAEDPGDMSAATGVLEGHAVGLLLALEEHGARVRPYPRGAREPGALRVTIGLQGGDPPRLLDAAAAVVDTLTVSSAWPRGATLRATLSRG